MNRDRRVTIASAGLGDVRELARVEIESKRASIPHLVEAAALDQASREQRWTIYLRGETPASAKPERRVFGAVVDSQMVGYIAGHLTTRWDMDAEVQSFYVLRAYQRQGIGSQLLLALAEWMIATGARRVCVGIAAENPYRAFYEKHGARYLNPHWLYWTDIRAIRETPRRADP